MSRLFRKGDVIQLEGIDDGLTRVVSHDQSPKESSIHYRIKESVNQNDEWSWQGTVTLIAPAPQPEERRGMTDVVRAAIARIMGVGFDIPRKDDDLIENWLRGTADDAVPIDAAWLVSVGFIAVPSNMVPNYNDHYELARLNLWDFNGAWWHINGLDHFPLRTRGSVRLLCKALDITMKEKVL